MRKGEATDELSGIPPVGPGPPKGSLLLARCPSAVSHRNREMEAR